MMMGLDLGDDWRDISIGRDHGCVHFILERFPLGLLIVGGRCVRLMGRLHRIVDRLAFSLQRRISRDGRIVGLFQFGLFGVGQKVKMVMVEAARRPAWGRSVG